MGYGHESQTEAEKNRFHQEVHIDAQQPVYGASNLQVLPTRGYEERKKQADDSIALVQQSAQQDTVGKRMQTLIDGNLLRSSWLTERKVPSKATIDTRMDRARVAFGLKAISGSQRTKRGKKFAEKAILQSKATNVLSRSINEREKALDAIMQYGRDSRIGWAWIADPRWDFGDRAPGMGALHDSHNDEFLKGVTEERDVEELGTMLKDFAYYEGRMAGFADRSMELKPLNAISAVDRMANTDTRRDAYKEFLQKLDELDLSQFEYKNNEEFFHNEGQKSFANRYAALRAFSHADRMLEIVKNDFSMEGKYPGLKLKTRLINEILTDYEMRASMIQSPYYTLLAGKDFKDMTDDDLKMRIRNAGDESIKFYLEAMLQKRKQTGAFGMGKKTAELLKTRKKEIEKNGVPAQLDTSREGLARYLSTNAHSRTIPYGQPLPRISPFINEPGMLPAAMSLKINELTEKTPKLQMKLEQRYVNEFGKTETCCYYQKVSRKNYDRMHNRLQSLEFRRAQIVALNELELETSGRQAEEIREYKKSIFLSEDYNDDLDGYSRIIDLLVDELRDLYAVSGQTFNDL